MEQPRCTALARASSLLHRHQVRLYPLDKLGERLFGMSGPKRTRPQRGQRYLERVIEEVREILENAGLAALLVTHDTKEAFQLADRIGVMAGGRLVQQGAAEQLAGADRRYG